VRSIKLFSDGALGSRGAFLVEPYHDDPHNHGLRLLSQPELMDMARKAYEKEYQLNVHCIGDAANKYVLNAMAQVLPSKNDCRWRIEHAQIVQPEDINIYQNYQIIPSIQPTHATSDMYWAEQRLGPERIKTAYAYRELLNAVGLVAIGSDFPVEDINPLLGFHAAVARQDTEGYPVAGFQPENALSRDDALKGMTIWAAYANFEEENRGSIEPGKNADFTILDEDIMEIAIDKIPQVKVAATIVGGERVY
ncbi:MAG: amidohydrolase, partial [Cyclobacteriaceae bacterium]